MKIWEPKTPGTLWATPELLRDSSSYHGESGFRSQQLSTAVCCFDVCLWNRIAGSTDMQTKLSEYLRGKYSPLLDNIALC